MANNFIGVYSRTYGPYGSAAPTPTVPAPTNLRATATTSSAISLAWDAVVGPYTLQRAAVTNGVTGSFTTLSNSLTTKSYQDAGLASITTYAYRVLVMVNGVASTYSAEYRATTASASGTNGNYITTDYITSDYIN